MKYAVIVSKKDKAGMNIAKQLEPMLVNREEIKLFIREEKSIDCENIDKEIDAEEFIFATKHESASGKPTLSVHFPGNFSKAELGGNDRTLCKANAPLLKALYLKLKELHDEVSLEVTHHGPYLEKPCLFIEIGSTEKEWINEDYGKIIAKTIAEITSKDIKDCNKVLVGIGGGHYPVNFNKILDRTNYCIGHICPKYQLENLNEDLLEQMLLKSNSDEVVVDWKGLGEFKEKVNELLKDRNWKRDKELLR